MPAREPMGWRGQPGNSCMRVSVAALLPTTLVLALFLSGQPQRASPPTFYRDVLPVLQDHCQRCHRSGEIGLMPLVTYSQTRFQARKIEKNVSTRRMPPWFADPCCGHFSDDPSLTPQEIATLSAWSKTPIPGNPADSPPASA